MQGDDKDKLNPSKSQQGKKEHQVDLKRVKEQPYNPSNPAQEFYREIMVLESQRSLLSRVGWRVTDLEREEEDLVLQCMALLSSQLMLPITPITHLQDRFTQERRVQVRVLWMEVHIHTQPESLDYLQLSKQTPQANIYHICQQVLLPLLKSFLKNRIAWSPLLKAGRTQADVLDLFLAEVIKPANAWMEGDLLAKRKE